MTDLKITIPDIGDFKDVEIIELLVKEGQSINKNDSLITLESDKSSVEVPSTDAGTIKKIHVKVGDKVNKGDLILRTRLRATAIHFAKDNLEKTGRAIASKKTTVYCCFPKKWRESQFMDTLRSVFHSSSDWNNLSVPPASKHSIIRISVEPDQLRQ